MHNFFDRHRKHVEDMSKHQYYKKLQDYKKRKEGNALGIDQNTLGPTKSLGLTILLALLIPGVGHIYLGFVRRGITILIVGIALWFSSMFIPFPWVWGINAVYWIWQIVDAYRRYQELKTW